MCEPKRPVNIHDSYHAHVYFDNDTLENAVNLCKQVGELYAIKIGNIHNKPIGPHPKWSCQIIFSNQHFDELIPWLDKNRNGLSILVHGVTGNDLKDHTDYAYWLGDSAELDLSIFND
jgi:DOPA 4,5-dioxygenase